MRRILVFDWSQPQDWGDTPDNGADHRRGNPNRLLRIPKVFAVPFCPRPSMARMTYLGLCMGKAAMKDEIKDLFFVAASRYFFGGPGFAAHQVAVRRCLSAGAALDDQPH